MRLQYENQAVPLLVETGAFEGVKRIAVTVAGDIGKVTGVKPQVMPEVRPQAGQTRAILCATLGHSFLAQALEQAGLLELSLVRGKREVYCIKKLAGEQLRQIEALSGLEELLVICGSDKRGTIYGMFALSEYIGVSPLCMWGDAEPMQRPEVELGDDIQTISREPSVRYRGFFINDEWPCFGNWSFDHFGGINAKVYEQVFELLLRLKGNYLWPAMWSSSFPIDGPGGANEELADIYGVVMGYSHHEPCLRASEEWDKVRGPETEYGNEWNFYTNEQGLLRYWEDALKRSGKYENLITIGMRGERDSSMLGDQATVEENVNLLKDIIRKQKALIREHVHREEAPMLLALYKEVEAYFYGDDQVKGLKDWDELDDVICMLCEDNFGHMRTLPTPEVRNRKGGWGMYYHFDYHGGPISYEWVDSTPMAKTWEQMCMAYEYGIRDVWIVNVGDLKFHEVPLSYFLALAYDYDKWGYDNKDSYREYTRLWARKNFPQASEELREQIGHVLTEYIDINALRRPEALNERIYHPCHYREADRMLERAEELERLSSQVMERLCDREKDAYYSMVHFSALASMNLLKMHLYAGKNIHYARQGRPIANLYGDRAKECEDRDIELARQMAAFKDGKWKGMELAQHIGFTKWNEDGYRYPLIAQVRPVHRPRMSVSRAEQEQIGVKNYCAPQVIRVPDFRYAGAEPVQIEIANDGGGSFDYRIRVEQPVTGLPAWLQLSSMEGTCQELERVTLSCDESQLPQEAETVRLLVDDGDAVVAVEVTGQRQSIEGLPQGTYLERQGVIVMDAAGYVEKRDTQKGAYQVIPGYGKYGSGVKVFPSTAVFTENEERPSLTWQFQIPEAGEYQVDLLVAPTNSVVSRQGVYVSVRNNCVEPCRAEIIPPDFRAGENGDPRWTQGVLDQIRVCTVRLPFEAGLQQLTVEALEAGVVLEQIRIHKAQIQPSYLGPQVSVRV
ncbi:MAG: glycosyl hydrolase 115 family protein [bacterium]|nr:glycosyl hydrolase 115 family protein [bacterium]MCM1375444.1 glycosyl hydrolase 115 family protein [Muribaculum sp.]